MYVHIYSHNPVIHVSVTQIVMCCVQLHVDLHHCSSITFASTMACTSISKLDLCSESRHSHWHVSECTSLVQLTVFILTATVHVARACRLPQQTILQLALETASHHIIKFVLTYIQALTDVVSIAAVLVPYLPPSQIVTIRTLVVGL